MIIVAAVFGSFAGLIAGLVAYFALDATPLSAFLLYCICGSGMVALGAIRQAFHHPVSSEGVILDTQNTMSDQKATALS